MLELRKFLLQYMANLRYPADTAAHSRKKIYQTQVYLYFRHEYLEFVGPEISMFVSITTRFKPQKKENHRSRPVGLARWFHLEADPDRWNRCGIHPGCHKCLAQYHGEPHHILWRITQSM